MTEYRVQTWHRNYKDEPRVVTGPMSLAEAEEYTTKDTMLAAGYTFVIERREVGPWERV